VLVCLSAAAIGQKAPPAKPFERFDGCVLKPDQWTDGDSFRVQLPDGRFETFRLYFVDTTESRSRGERSDEQAVYFGLTRAQAIQLGNQAKTFTAHALAQPFTIYTRWRSVFGARYYAIVITAGGRDLNELLVSSGLARIYGTRTPLPDGRDSREYLAHLHALEDEAKAAKRGGWGMVHT
jgi:endonuclease YncB( thermonuclease family)